VAFSTLTVAARKPSHPAAFLANFDQSPKMENQVMRKNAEITYLWILGFIEYSVYRVRNMRVWRWMRWFLALWIWMRAQW